MHSKKNLHYILSQLIKIRYIHTNNIDAITFRTNLKYEETKQNSHTKYPQKRNLPINIQNSIS